MSKEFPRKKCKSCPAEVIWTFTANGAKQPVDAEPVSSGTLHLFWTGAGVHSAYVPVDSRVPGEPLYVAHHATCPDVASYR